MNLMPSIVIDVSAMLVDTTHFRTPSGAISNTFGKTYSFCIRAAVTSSENEGYLQYEQGNQVFIK